MDNIPPLLGRLHLLFLHLPIGLIAGLAALRCLPALRQSSARPLLSTLWLLTAGSALLTAGSGWLLIIGEGNQWGAIGWWHQWLGSALALVIITAATLWWQQRTLLSDSLLAVAVILTIATGHFGGSMTHGRDFLFVNPPPSKPVAQPAAATSAEDESISAGDESGAENDEEAGEEAGEEANSEEESAKEELTEDQEANSEVPADSESGEQGENNKPGESSEPSESSEAPSEHSPLTVAARQALWQAAHAVMVEHCIDCHNSNRQRGYLNLQNHASIMLGGGSGAAVVPGDPGQSPLLTLAMLPEDNWDRMPPEGPPLSEAELSALRAWILAGAPDDQGNIATP